MWFPDLSFPDALMLFIYSPVALADDWMFRERAVACTLRLSALLAMNNDAAFCCAQSSLRSQLHATSPLSLTFLHKPRVALGSLNSQFCCTRGGTHPKINSAQGLTGPAPQGHGSASLSSKTFENKQVHFSKTVKWT